MMYLFLQNNYTYYNQENMVLRTMRKFTDWAVQTKIVSWALYTNNCGSVRPFVTFEWAESRWKHVLLRVVSSLKLSPLS